MSFWRRMKFKKSVPQTTVSLSIFLFMSAGNAFAEPTCARVLIQTSTSAVGFAIGPLHGEFLGLGNKPIHMREKYRGEENGKWIMNEAVTGQHLFEVKYFTEDERESLHVHIQAGLLMDVNNETFDTTGSTEGYALFVVDLRGNLLILKTHERYKLQHSSLVAGEDVLIAGTIQVENGVITGLNNDSGHYHSDPKMLQNFVDLLRSKKVKVQQNQVQYFVPD